MRPSGQREKQRRNLPCRASPVECCLEHRESLSGPCQNFSGGRHLWFGPMRSPPRRRMVQPQIKWNSDRSTTFACDFPPADFLSSDPRGGNPGATWERDRKWLKTGRLRQEEKDEAQGRSCGESNEWNGCQHVDRVSFRMGSTSRESEYEFGGEASTPRGFRRTQNVPPVKKVTNSGLRSRRNCI